MDIHSWIKDKSITEYESYLTRLFLCLQMTWCSLHKLWLTVYDECIVEVGVITDELINSLRPSDAYMRQ